MSLQRVHARLVRRALSIVAGLLIVALPAFAADPVKIPLYAPKEVLWKPSAVLSSSFDVMPFPAEGALQHAVLLDGHASEGLGDSAAAVRAAFEAGMPIVIVAVTPQSQSLLDDITGGSVDLPNGVTARPAVLGEPRLEAIALRRPAGSATADVGEFWVTFDDDDGTAVEEKAEDRKLIASIAEWVGGDVATAAPVAPKRAAPRMAMKANAEPKGRVAIDDLTSSVIRKVNLAFDQGSVSTVVRSWAAYSPSQQEDWYIFELTTNSQPLNFATYSLNGMFADWVQSDEFCRGLAKTGCKRTRYATKVQVKLASKTPGLELLFYGPDSDRAQDEYSYSSKFSLGGKVTAGYDDKGPKGGVELSGGAEFSRSSKVTIKDATLIGISNPTTDTAGWRFEMPQMRAVNDLSAFNGPSMSCDNLLQMPYPVQRGSMESKQYAIFRLPAEARASVKGIDVAVSLLLEESSSRLQNWTAAYCNIFNCNCTPESWVHKTYELKDNVISFPLASHTAAPQ